MDAAAYPLRRHPGGEGAERHASRAAGDRPHRRRRAHARVCAVDCHQARRSSMRTLVAALLLAPVIALAQAWPQKPIKVIVPFPPGGVTDAIARITADWLTPRLAQP